MIIADAKPCPVCGSKVFFNKSIIHDTWGIYCNSPRDDKPHHEKFRFGVYERVNADNQQETVDHLVAKWNDLVEKYKSGQLPT